MITKNLIISLIVLTVFISCDEISTPKEKSYNNSILYTLKANVPKQEIFIYKTVAPLEKGQDYGGFQDYIVEEADIMLLADNLNFDNFSIKESKFGKKYFSNEADLKVLPNTNYRLEVFSNGELFTGKTTTPGDFEILDYEKRNFVKHEYSKIKISWTESKNATMYGIYLYEAYFEERANPPSYITFDIVNTNYTSIDKREFEFHLNERTDSLKVEVFAFDKNYYNHAVHNIDTAGVKNAYGYFGSAVVKSIIFVKE